MNPLLKGLRERHWIAIDVACTVLLVLVYGVEFNLPADLTGVPRGVAALIVAVAVLPAAARLNTRSEGLHETVGLHDRLRIRHSERVTIEWTTS